MNIRMFNEAMLIFILVFAGWAITSDIYGSPFWMIQVAHWTAHCGLIFLGMVWVNILLSFSKDKFKFVYVVFSLLWLLALKGDMEWGKVLSNNGNSYFWLENQATYQTEVMFSCEEKGVPLCDCSEKWFKESGTYDRKLAMAYEGMLRRLLIILPALVIALFSYYRPYNKVEKGS